jgi:hypothetical protein
MSASFAGDAKFGAATEIDTWTYVFVPYCTQVRALPPRCAELWEPAATSGGHQPFGYAVVT